MIKKEQKDKTVVTIDTSAYRILQELALYYTDTMPEKITVPKAIAIISAEKINEVRSHRRANG